MGLSVSDAVRILLKRVASDQAFPLELKVPNAQTRVAMAQARHGAYRVEGVLFTAANVYLGLKIGLTFASALRAFLPSEAAVQNPVDMIASASAENFERTVRLVAGDPGHRVGRQGLRQHRVRHPAGGEEGGD